MSYTKVHDVEMVYIDMAAETQDTRPMMLRRHEHYCRAHPTLQIRLGENTFCEVSAHLLYDAVFDLVRGDSVSGISLVKGEVANYSSQELFDLAGLAKLSEEQAEDLGPETVTTQGGEP